MSSDNYLIVPIVKLRHHFNLSCCWVSLGQMTRIQPCHEKTFLIENSPFLYEQWQLLIVPKLSIWDIASIFPAAEYPWANLQCMTLSRGDFLIKKSTTWRRGCGYVETPGVVDRNCKIWGVFCCFILKTAKMIDWKSIRRVFHTYCVL